MRTCHVFGEMVDFIFRHRIMKEGFSDLYFDISTLKDIQVEIDLETGDGEIRSKFVWIVHDTGTKLLMLADSEECLLARQEIRESPKKRKLLYFAGEGFAKGLTEDDIIDRITEQYWKLKLVVEKEKKKKGKSSK